MVEKLGLTPRILKNIDLQALALSVVKREAGVKESFTAGVSETARAIPAFSKASSMASVAFKKWFGKSKVKDIVYHGSPTFGQTEEAWTFEDKPASNTGSPMAGLGFFFAEDKTEGQGYTKGIGNVEPVYLRIENPFEINSWELPEFKDQAEAKAFAKRNTEIQRVGDSFWSKRHKANKSPWTSETDCETCKEANRTERLRQSVN